MHLVAVEILNEKALALLHDLERLVILRVVPHEETISKNEILDSIRKGLNDVQLHRRGKKKLNTLQELIDEL